MMRAMKILIVLTSHDKLGTSGKPTGFWLEELAVPYRTFAAAGASIDLASPRGGKAPVDPGSTKDPSADVQAFLADPVAVAKMTATLPLATVAGDYDAVFVAGGHGVMWDLADAPVVAGVLSRAYQRGAVVAAVCHGPAALVGATKGDGTPLVAGHRFAAFSNDEERAVGLAEVVPFLLESKLTELGGRYERGEMWKPHAVRDGRLVTGQNPASSRPVAEHVLAALVSAA
jgi:putative intracellular protease/amidase